MSLKNRFIPAGAGNSDFGGGGDWGNTVYPRWRGELYRCELQHHRHPGLSPLSRGTPITQGRQCGPFRFIPAGAGNSYIIDMERGKWEVYPRWRGELVCSCWGVAAIAGLSPLARGTRLTILVRNNQRRFIPAGAGNSVNITYY